MMQQLEQHATSKPLIILLYYQLTLAIISKLKFALVKHFFAYYYHCFNLLNANLLDLLNFN